jgi:hypothetical protein
MLWYPWYTPCELGGVAVSQLKPSMYARPKLRTVVFAIAIFVAPLALGGALSAALWRRPPLLGHFLEPTGEHFRWIHRAATIGAPLLLYVWFLRPLPAGRVLHVLVVFAIVEAVQFAAGVTVTGNVSDAFVLQALMIDLAVGLVAVGIAAVIWPAGWRTRANASRVD